MKIKDSTVRFANLQPQLILALIIADSVYAKHGQELVITSLNDGKHKLGSKHYSGCAADLRTNFFTVDKAKKVSIELKEALGNSPDLDVVLEATHIHLEYHPKSA